MKKFLSLLLLLCFIPLPCLANSWGLKGELYQAVSSVDTWNDYTTISTQVDDIAVMGSRYHNALMLVYDGELKVYSTAVYQPDKSDTPLPSLSGGSGIITLSYGEDEIYTFMDNGHNYQLTSAKIDNFLLTYDSATMCYYASENGERVIANHTFLLSSFNIDLFPRSLDDVRHLNLMNAALESGSYLLGQPNADSSFGIHLEDLGKGTTPVYSAPWANSAWRASKGKAAVSLGDEFWAHALYTNQDGETYALIHYDVSQRTQRFGFISADVLGKHADSLSPTFYPLQVPLRAKRDTYLTDDPLVSQFHQFDVPADTLFTCFGLFSNDYAYVGAEVKDNSFVSGGKIVWGFVPLIDLELFCEPAESSILQSLSGRYLYHSGIEILHGAFILNEDGTYFCDNEFASPTQLMSATQGRWTLYHNNGLFSDDCPYVIVFFSERGETFVRGLSLEDNVLTLDGPSGFGCYTFDPPAYSPEG